MGGGPNKEEIDNEEIAKRLEQIRTEGGNFRSSRQFVISIVFFLVIFVAIVLSRKQFNWGEISFGYLDNSTSIQVLDRHEDKILLQVTNGDNMELRLFSMLDNSMLDLSRGILNIHKANMSPDGNYVAFNSTSLDRVNLVYIESYSIVNGPLATFLEQVEILDESKGKVNICEWSDLAWSDNSENIAFFLCQTDSSILVWWARSQIDQLHVVPNSKGRADTKRSLAWYEDILLYSMTTDDKPSLLSYEVNDSGFSSKIFGTAN